MRLHSAICFLTASLATGAVSAASIDVATYTLLPNTPNQTIDIIIRPGDPPERLLGLDFFAMINPPKFRFDHHEELVEWALGAAAGPPDPVLGPVFTGLQIFGDGLVFNAGRIAHNPAGDNLTPRVVISSVVTDKESVPAEGVLARLTLDTSGINAPVNGHDYIYSLELANFVQGLGYTAVYDEHGYEVLRYAEGGQRLRIAASDPVVSVPEPASCMLLVTGIACLLFRTRHRRSW